MHYDALIVCILSGFLAGRSVPCPFHSTVFYMRLFVVHVCCMLCNKANSSPLQVSGLFDSCNAMPSGAVYTRLPGVSQACRPHHSAGGDDAGKRLPSLQSWPSLCPELTQTLPSEPHRDAGEYIITASSCCNCSPADTHHPANAHANMVIYPCLSLSTQ